MGYIVREQRYIKGIIAGIIIGCIGLLVGNRSGFLIFGVLFYEVIIVTKHIVSKMMIPKVKKLKSGIKLLSDISFAIYLTHYFILKLGSKYLTSIHWIGAYLLFLVFAIGLGYVTYRFIEVPIVKYANKKVCLWKVRSK